MEECWKLGLHLWTPEGAQITLLHEHVTCAPVAVESYEIRDGCSEPFPLTKSVRRLVSSSSITREKSRQSEIALGGNASDELELRAVAIIRCDFKRSL